MTTPTVKATDSTIPAAGAVLWRPAASGHPEVALVHRPRYDDWSLPKGKLDPGETHPEAAVREIEEETGYHARLGSHLMRVSYPVGKKQRKVVDYWSARSLSGKFTPNSEVDKLEWLPIPDAHKRLRYALDRKVLGKFGQLPTDTRSVLLVRHALAGRRDKYSGNDVDRPLDARGRAQAAALVPQILAFGVERIVTAHPARCQQTVALLAQALGVEPAVQPAFSEAEYTKRPAETQRALLSLLKLAKVSVVCSQGEVIPPLLEWLSARHGFHLPPARNRKGSMWVLTVTAEGRAISADHFEPPPTD